jgi:hypothetical protein
MTLPGAAPTSARATAPTPTIGPRSSVSSRERRASSGFGWVTTRTDGLVRSSSAKTFRLAARIWIPMSGRATGGVIRPMPRSATASTNGRGMMMGMADVRSIVTPVKGQERHSAPICGPSAGSTSSTCICRWPRMRPWSMRNASHPS